MPPNAPKSSGRSSNRDAAHFGLGTGNGILGERRSPPPESRRRKEVWLTQENGGSKVKNRAAIISAIVLLCLSGTAHGYQVGDLNCDDSVNFFDIDPFVLAITDPAAYEAAYPDCDIMLADCNGDGLVNFFDIGCFVELITSPPEGACCFPDGSCTEGTADDCDDAGGVYQGDDTVCDPNPCPQPVGACCFTDDSCLELTEDECLDAGGEWLGADVGCDPNPCVGIAGACCFLDGSCEDLTPVACAAAGGVYTGDFVGCDSYPCPQPEGACCFPDGSCTVQTEDDCLASDGDWLGMDTDCTPNPCPQPTGACCYLDGSCAELTADECASTGGDWQGMDTDCTPNPCPEPTGACCHPDGSCTMATEADCTGQYQGDGTDCSPNPCEPYCEEATIRVEILTDNYPNETTWVVVEQGTGTIMGSGGPYGSTGTLYIHEICVTYMGCYDFTIYDSYGDGICCGYGYGHYEVYYEDDLVGEGGDFGSQETVSSIGGCIFEGACCFADGSCTDGMDEDSCAGAGGVYQGDFTDCSPNPCPQPGACCLPDGTCTVTQEADCDGAWQGPGTDCSPNPCGDLGACCYPDGTCEYVLDADCGGDWQGAGTVCDPNPCPQPPSGACCLPDGNCVDDMTEANCTAAGGTYQGDDVLCATVSCPEPSEPTMTQLAGNSLSAYPRFEYVKAFNENATVEVAIDPTRFPGLVGQTCDIYLVDAKDVTGWQIDPSLADVTSGGELTVTFAGGTIQANTFTVAGSYELDSAVYVPETLAYTGLGAPYDVVIDVDQNGQLDSGDYIDGYSDEAGLYVVHDTTDQGPITVVQPGDYSVGTVFGIPSGDTNERLYYPANIGSLGQLPLIVISHGNGHNYRWYDHIGHHMASYGYIVMAHDNNTGPGIEYCSVTTLGHTDAIIDQQDTIAGGALNGHIDTDRIIWIGHSRGAEGVARAFDRIYDSDYTHGAVPPTGYGLDSIILISSMLPVDFLKTAKSNPHHANYHLWTAAGDSDVNGSASCDLCQTFHLHDRATKYRMSTILQGTGHGWFHDGSGGAYFTGPCSIGEANTHLIQLGLFLPLIKHYAEGNIPATDFFWRQYEHFHPIGVDTSDPCIVVTSEYRNGSDTGNFMIDDYQSNSSTTLSSSGGSVTYTVQNLTEGRLDDNNSSFSWTSSDPFNGATQCSSSDDSKGVVFDWNNNDRYYEWEVISAWQDFSDDLYLSFRGAQGTQHPYNMSFLGDTTFSVTLSDGTGTTSSINTGAYGGGFEQPYQRSGGWHNEMEVIKIRLTDFLHNGSGLDLSDIEAIRLDVGPSWGSDEGRIVIDEMMITNDHPPL